MSSLKSQLKDLTDKLIKSSPTYDEEVFKDRSRTSKLMYNRSRVGLHRVIGPGFHMEAEHYLFDRRFKLPMFRHFRYFGPRGELFIYFLLLVGIRKAVTNNLQREENIESLLNDRNTFFKVELPVSFRRLD
jgi:hypothetical protein